MEEAGGPLSSSLRTIAGELGQWRGSGTIAGFHVGEPLRDWDTFEVDRTLVGETGGLP